jgi:hypothetical protein
MTDYRLYRIGGDGHIKGVETVKCASDEEARMAAIDLRGDLPAMEIWSETRFVARVGAPKKWIGLRWNRVVGMKNSMLAR